MHAADARNPRRGDRPVKPQSAAFLEKSRQFLAKAQDLLDAHRWPDEAAARRISLVYTQHKP